MSDSNHGILYSPSSVSSSSSPPITAKNVRDLQLKGIEYIRLQWVDLTSIVRFRVLPFSYFLKLLESPRPSVAVAKVAFGLVYLQAAEGFAPVGEYLIVPDFASLRISPFEPGLATIMGWFQEKAPRLIGSETTLRAELCPRTILERTVKQAEDQARAQFLVGFEVEFILLKSTDPVEPLDRHHWTSSDGLRSGSVASKILREIADCLRLAGIGLTMYHAEAAPGQYEVVLEPLLPLAAADALIHTREIIVNVAAKHGVRATFAPRVSQDSCGSGLHAHISVHSTAPSASPKPADKLSSLESSFLAGVLDHIPALMAVTLPTPASYKRVGDGIWSGGTYVCWGTENREAPVRLTNASSPNSRNFELRFIDATCNPYLALAGIISTGTKAVLAKAELKHKDCYGDVSAALLSEEERKELGITQRLALTWPEARKKFAADKTMEEIFGKYFIESYLSVNKTLGDLLNQDQDEDAILTRLVEFY